MSLALALTAAALYSCGTYLLLQRRLTRIVLGLVMLGHGSVLLLLVSGGRSGQVPITDDAGGGTFSDPFVQALGLTAIVITFAVTAFLLTLAHRSWELTDDDETQDDLEDRRLAVTDGDEDLDDDFDGDFEQDDDPRSPENGSTEEIRSRGDQWIEGPFRRGTRRNKPLQATDVTRPQHPPGAMT